MHFEGIDLFVRSIHRMASVVENLKTVNTQCCLVENSALTITVRFLAICLRLYNAIEHSTSSVRKDIFALYHFFWQ